VKKGIHPAYKMTTITCACGHELVTGSTVENLKIDVCSKCHPFFKGQLRNVTAGGRIDQFKKKYSLK
jgi:large subunit ribosomal protein L31